ncbi:hypothetical protein BX070DRAFT_152791 [Coemansia spiralis]|nr:hypothetical protein BX070DRAFT_152791 [Coemansia spiralis]
MRFALYLFPLAHKSSVSRSPHTSRLRKELARHYFSKKTYSIMTKSASPEIRGQTTRAALRYFDRRCGRTNWEAVAQELRTPLLECLQSVDSRHPIFHPRHIPETEEWSIDDIADLKQFTETYFQHSMTVDDWMLAGRYMNIYHNDCIAKMWALSTFQMTPLLFSQIAEYRQAGLLWPTICCKIGAPSGSPSPSSDIIRYLFATTNKDSLKPTKRPKAQFRISKHQHWTKEEDSQLLELLSRFNDGHDIDWNFISKSIGHSKNACRYRRILLTRPANTKSSRASSADSQ